MKHYMTTCILGFAALGSVYAQDKIDLSDLSVPSAPTFILTDITPSLVQSPTTPKKLILGLAESYSKSNGGFPNNYSAEFTPYWFVNPAGRSVYAAMGIKTSQDSDGATIVENKENVFSGLQFGRVSLAFISKDLIPDKEDLAHKIFSFGYKTTVIKVQQKGYANKVIKLIDKWHRAAQMDLEEMQDSLINAPQDAVKIQAIMDFYTKKLAEAEESRSRELANVPQDSVKIQAIMDFYTKKFAEAEESRNRELANVPQDTVKIQAIMDFYTKKFAEPKKTRSKELVKQIEEQVQEKPRFSWDVAGAYAMYGIGDQRWKSGRTGVWTTFSTYLPLAVAKSSNNYLNLNLSARSLFDNFSKNEKDEIVRSNSFDLGGKAALEFDNFSVGVESLYRYKNGEKGTENRTIGIVNFKIADNIFISGMFGKNFQSQSRTIALFGINWGFGSEKLDIPASK